MSILFISDLHLSGERPGIINLFLRFLEEQAAHAEALYILGDLFEAWIGDDYIEPALQPVISALQTITRPAATTGTPVYIMHGNRDFLLAQEFAQQTRCELIDDPTVVDLFGTPTLLMHGDTLCTDDTDYQKLRQQFHNKAWQQQVLTRSIEERLGMARKAREDSIRATGKKSENIMDVNQQAVEQAFRDNHVTRLIHGHTHRPDTHSLQVDGHPATRIVLGDWYRHGSVLECNETGCTLHQLA